MLNKIVIKLSEHSVIFKSSLETVEYFNSQQLGEESDSENLENASFF